MKIFPIGDVSATSNQGTIDGINYSMFEPNINCKSHPVYNVLQTRYGDQSLTTRKKSEPYLQIVYSYQDIFTREYRQLARAIDDVEESLTPLYVVDFSAGLTPSNVASGSAKWNVSISDTFFYSATAGYKANRAFLWNGKGWKEGAVTGLTLNTTVVVDIQSNNYGALSLSDASNSMIYPMYDAYIVPGVLQNFAPGEYWREDITTGDPGGYLYTGNISFVSRYKV